ncbi:MAG TPA: hypothetical protein VMS64_32740 [Candidatus Methylomirabilis sp.]|nr:hypothetical protein [Candidatus Methylomirabilis sp.]
MTQDIHAMSVTERLNAARPTKTLLFWSCVACIIATMIIGFTWGGWVRGATAQSMAEAKAERAVVKRLAPMCMAQFERDPAREEKLKALKALDVYERSEYVKKQGWATMLGEKEPDDAVADKCAALIVG